MRQIACSHSGKSWYFLGTLLALGLLLLLPGSVVFAAPGDLDPSFGVNGVVITDFGFSSTDGIGDVAIQSDGKIVAAGVSGGNFALARYNPDGSLDSSFDADGKVVGSGNSEPYFPDTLTLRLPGLAAGFLFKCFVL